jgi:anti-sigma regulatory factor (Ser/Thr protein kinase)
MVRREPGEQKSSLELVTLPSAPYWARRYTSAALHAWQLVPETIETAELLVSELVTNAIRASGPKPGPLAYSGPEGLEHITLTLRLLPGRVVIEVFDHDPSAPVLAEAGPDSESGRGLMIVDIASKEWGYQYPPSGGKIVFCVLDIPQFITYATGQDVPGSPYQ